MEGETGGGENGDLPSNRYGAVCYDDCPQIFPCLVAQFYDMASQYPSIIAGSKNSWIAEICDEEDCMEMIAIVDHQTLKVVSGISWAILPKIRSLYVCYMITLKEHRGKGFQRTLFELMKKRSVSLYPEDFTDGFDAILADTRAAPSTIPQDYFSTWNAIEATQKALNRIGFYQCCFNYLMVGDLDDKGNIEELSDEFVCLIHKDSKAIKPSKNPDFKYEVDSFLLEVLQLTFIRSQQSVKLDPRLQEYLGKCLSAIPVYTCNLRRSVPFFRTDKLFPDHFG